MERAGVRAGGSRRTTEGSRGRASARGPSCGSWRTTARQTRLPCASADDIRSLEATGGGSRSAWRKILHAGVRGTDRRHRQVHPRAQGARVQGRRHRMGVPGKREAWWEKDRARDTFQRVVLQVPGSKQALHRGREAPGDGPREVGHAGVSHGVLQGLGGCSRQGGRGSGQSRLRRERSLQPAHPHPAP